MEGKRGPSVTGSTAASTGVTVELMIGFVASEIVLLAMACAVILMVRVGVEVLKRLRVECGLFIRGPGVAREIGGLGFGKLICLSELQYIIEERYKSFDVEKKKFSS